MKEENDKVAFKDIPSGHCFTLDKLNYTDTVYLKINPEDVRVDINKTEIMVNLVTGSLLFIDKDRMVYPVSPIEPIIIKLTKLKTI